MGNVTWGDAARFCNWLQNGQPTGAEGDGHDRNRGVHSQWASQSALMAITRNAGATYFIPSENEWYKAAYYNGRRDQRQILDVSDAEQHRADQHPVADRHEQRQLRSQAAKPIRRIT